MDVVNQLVSYCTLLRKSSSHWHKLVMLMFDVVLTNSHTLWKHYTTPVQRQSYGRVFRRILIAEILAENPDENEQPAEHQKSKLPNNSRKRCRGCLDEGHKNKRTQYFCAAWEDQPTICPEHWHQFHKSLSDYVAPSCPFSSSSVLLLAAHFMSFRYFLAAFVCVFGSRNRLSSLTQL